MAAGDDFLEMLAQARLGDRQALERLAELYEPEVRIVARVQLGAPLRAYLDSIDVVQSVHRSIIRGLRDDRFDLSCPENLVALAVSMVRHKVARHWRKLRRQQRGEVGGLGQQAAMHLLATLSDSSGDPAMHAQLIDQLDHVWDHVDEVDRGLLELRLDGCTTAEAARRLGLDPDVTRVRLGRLRHRLRAAGVLAELV